MKELRLDGVIGDFFNTAEDFAYRLDELNLSPGEDLVLKINSPGGSVFDGFSIYNQLKSLDNKVIVKIEGLAASIASLVALAGDEVSMTEVGSFMIHRASTMAAGDQDDLESVVEGLKQIDDTLVNVYATKTGISAKDIEEMMDKETWMSPQTALDKGFIDKIEETLKAVAFLQSNQTFNMKKLDELFAKLGLANAKAEAENESQEETQNATETEAAAETQTNEAATENEEVENEENSEETEETTNQKIDRLVELVGGLVEKVNRQDETISALNNGMQDFVDNRIKQIAKGIKSNGTVPIGQGTFNSNTPAYTPKFQNFREAMKEIDKNTRNKISN